MKITKQTNPIECGVCVINSLTNHFYHKNDKASLLDRAIITDNGMSLSSFELLALEAGIYAESFDCDWSEFVGLKNKLYVCLVKNDRFLHYVIIDKKKGGVVVYDSVAGQSFMPLEEFSKIYNGILITVSKTRSYSIKKLFPPNIFGYIKTWFVMVSLLVHCCVLALGVLCANYVNIIFQESISNDSLTNGLFLSLLFLFIFIVNNLFVFLLSQITLQSIKKNNQYLINLLISSLLFKNNYFFNKVNRGCFYMMDQAILNISAFISNDINTFVSSLILLVAVNLYLLYINPYFTIPFLISIIVNLLFCWASLLYKKHIFSKTLADQVDNNTLVSKYSDYLCSQRNARVENRISQGLHRNLNKINEISVKSVRFGSQQNLFLNTMMNFFYIAIVVLCSYFIIKQQGLDIGDVTLLISLYSLQASAISVVCAFPEKVYLFNKMKSIYLDFVSLSNYQDFGKKRIKEIENISWEDKSIKNGSCLHDKKILTGFYTLSQEIAINGEILRHFRYESVQDKLQIVDHHTILTSVSKDVVYSSLYAQAIRIFHLNYAITDDDFKKQIMKSLLSYLGVKNKIIIINCQAINFSPEEKDWLKNTLITQLGLANYVIVFF